MIGIFDIVLHSLLTCFLIISQLLQLYYTEPKMISIKYISSVVVKGALF